MGMRVVIVLRLLRFVRTGRACRGRTRRGASRACSTITIRSTIRTSTSVVVVIVPAIREVDRFHVGRERRQGLRNGRLVGMYAAISRLYNDHCFKMTKVL